MENSRSTALPKFEGIQALRGFAALMVVWTHLKHTGDFSAIPWINNGVGAAGVDVFFVISGFVISFSAKALGYDARQFFINRITRVAPIYWLTAIPLIITSLMQHKSSWQAMLSTFTFLPLFDFGAYSPPTNNFGWTLGFEFWFYLSSALIMALFADRVWKALALALVIGAYLVKLYYTGSYVLPYFIFSPLLLEFFFGILIFRYMHLLNRKMIIPLAVAALVMFWVICLGVMDGDYMLDAKSGLQKAIIAGGFGACLVATVVAAEINGFDKWPKWTTALGNCSFSIYLLQPYGLWLANNGAHRFHLTAWQSGFVFLASSVLLGILTTVYIEKPLTRAVRNTCNRLFSKRQYRSKSVLSAA